jgi:cell division protein FtsB
LTKVDAPARIGSFRPVLGASVVLFLSLLAVAGVKSYHDLEAARQRKLTLETRIRSTETEIARLQNRIERLRSDPGLLERLAREDLGMVRPGDVVVELPLEDVGGVTPMPPAPVAPGPVQPAPLQPAPAPPVQAPSPAPDPATLVPASSPAPSSVTSPATTPAPLPAAAPAGPGGPADPPPGTP